MEGENSNIAGGWDGDVPHDDMDVVGDDADADALPGVIPPAAVNAVNAYAKGSGSGSCSQSITSGDVDIVRRFLRDVSGVAENIVENGTWGSLVGYAEGRLAQVLSSIGLFVGLLSFL